MQMSLVKGKIKDKWIELLVGKDIEPELVKKDKRGEASGKIIITGERY